MSDPHLDTAWQALRAQAEQYAHSMGLLATSESRALMEDVTRRYCELPAPTTDDELNLRLQQQLHVSGVISSISHAESMAATAEGAWPETFKLSRVLSEEPLPASIGECQEAMEERIHFSGKISSICTEYRMRSYRHG